MSCLELFQGAAKLQKSLNAPILIFPKCHRKAHLDVFVDSRNNTIILCCSKCDRTIAKIKISLTKKAL